MIYFIGPISPPDNGPGIKNKIIVEELIKKNIGIKIYNTLGRKNRVACFVGLFRLLLTERSVILSVSEKGRYFYVPILALSQRLRKKRIVLLPAGGFLDVEIENMNKPFKRYFINFLNSFEMIFPESIVLASGLHDIGVKNIEVLPNPRRTGLYNRKKFDKSQVKIYFISSIKKDKGIIDAINSVELLNKKDKNVTLHIYGRIQKGFEEEFENTLKDNTNCEYHGTLSNKEVIETLATRADILVLPTYYFGEGLPGILVEAAIAKVPVIITNFKGIDAYFIHNKNTLYVEKQNPKDLADKIEQLIEDDELRNKITTGITELSKQFDVENIVSRILKAV